MSRVAVVGWASTAALEPDGRNEAELLGPVVDQALGMAGLSGAEVDVVCSAGSEFLNGVVGTVMGAFDALPGWPPRTHSHLEADGAFALYEAWIRLMAGEGGVALACAFGRPSAADPAGVLALQQDPYLVGPLGTGPRHLAALQARAMIDTGRCTERDLAEIAAARRGLDVAALLAMPHVASPLRESDCSAVCAGAAAVVLATEDRVPISCERPAWIVGIDQRMESARIGQRDLTVSTSTRLAADRLGLPGSSIDVLEVHAPFSHQELLVIDALGAGRVGSLNPSGGVLPADPLMASGLVRIGAAADALLRGGAHRAVGHATNGACLQHNLLCLLEGA